jgi:hypothetical protein
VIEVPEFVRGEAGFTIKLNQLAEAVRELQAANQPSTADSSLPFNPNDNDVDEVNDYLEQAAAEERERVLKLESEGKARKGILAGPHSDL